MPGVLSKRQTEILKPYLEGSGPGEDGEWGLHCPLHDDRNRSASLNILSGDWYCHACAFGANVEYLVSVVQSGRAITPPGSARSNGHAPAAAAKPLPSEATVQGWHSHLLTGDKLGPLLSRRGLTTETIERWQVGWSSDSRAYTLPVRNLEGELVNCRFYQLDPLPDRRKIWGVRGHNVPTLYPLSAMLDESEIIICEGEWDALLTIQNGFAAVTRTAAAKVWKSLWNHYFDDKLVYVVHDMDEAGQAANELVAESLKKNAREVRVVQLPYPVTPDHGKDLTDYWLDGFDRDDFKGLLSGAPGSVRDERVVAGEFLDVNVLDSFDAGASGQRLRMRVTITGKRNPPYLLPQEVRYFCTQDAGVKCQVCPMNEMGGTAVRTIDSHDPVILEMMGATAGQMTTMLREHLGAQKCHVLTIEPLEHRSVEELFVRPAVDRVSGSDGDYTNRKIVSVGRHDSLPNNTVELVGTIFPNPRGQHNEFQAWELTRTETSIDKFEVNDETLPLLGLFKPARGERPLKKLAAIARELSTHVTKIYGRVEMHALIDLVYHSVLAFDFNGTRVDRGWLEALVVGDTRTGKSEAADRLRRHYGAGELVSCESASFAGVVGGLQQLGSGKEWEVTWGAIPINDGRLVILDEVSGLATEQIAQMSSIRSSGEAQLTKIRSERTWARTRLLWFGNPRDRRMSDFTYGVQALKGLIGNNEDIARFDLAMSVAADEVDAAEINREHTDGSSLTYTAEACRAMVLWAWSRKPEQVVWDEGAEQAVFAAAIELGKRYVEDPPLLQSANARIKVARIAVALAARTFSSDKAGENILVGVVHVQDAVKFIDTLYSMKGFGYRDVSTEALLNLKEASENYDAAKQYLHGNPELTKFLRQTGHFRRQDLEESLNLVREQANGIINTLWKFRMIRRRGADIHMNPLLHELLRELR